MGLFNMIRPESLVTPNHSVDVLLNVAQYSLQKKLFGTDFNDKKIVKKAVKVTNEFISLEAYIRTHYNSIIRETFTVSNITGEMKGDTYVLTDDDVVIVTTLDITELNAESAVVEVLKVKDAGVESMHYIFLNSHAYRITNDMLVIRVTLGDLKYHIPINIKKSLIELI